MDNTAAMDHDDNGDTTGRSLVEPEVDHGKIPSGALGSWDDRRKNG